MGSNLGAQPRENVSLGLAAMIKEVVYILDSADLPDEVADAAHTALISLAKSAAIHGFNLTAGDKEK